MLLCIGIFGLSRQGHGPPWKGSGAHIRSTCSVLRFEARVGVKALRGTMSVESGHTGTTLWALRELTRHAILSWVHTSGGICPPLGLHDTLQWSNHRQSCCLRQRQKGHLTQRLRPPHPSPSTLPDSDHAGGVLLQRPYVDSGS